jgi:hypothetical protein
MGNGNQPLIRLDPNGTAPILSYNLPEPSIYFGRNFIELDYDDTFFTPKAKKTPSPDVRVPLRDLSGLDRDALLARIRGSMAASFADTKLFPNARVSGGSLRIVEAEGVAPANVRTVSQPLGIRVNVISTLPAGHLVTALDPNEVASMLQAGRRLSLFTSMYGTPRHKYLSEPAKPTPTILLVETYRLASYLGIYGAGRVVKTFSLLPGERTKISVRTFLKSEEDRKNASSILDSCTEESAIDFEETVADEQSSKETFEKSFQYYAEAEAKASWGFGSAKVKGGVKGGSNSAREEFAKNTTTVTNKHAQKASAKRDVQINTSYEVKETEEEETSTEREIENINLSRTLNFVFRQMNQEFVTVLSLVDVRVAFFNGYPETRREVALYDLDALLEEYILPANRAQVRQEIQNELDTILDFQGNVQTGFVASRSITQGATYLRVDTQRTSIFTDPITGTSVTVPGIILSVTRNVMRTEGVIVEALLGVGDALDEYATSLQKLEVQRRRAEAASVQAQSDRAELLNDLVRNGDETRARLLEDLTCPCGPDKSVLDINVHHQATKETDA